MPHPSSCAGRILTLFSLAFLIVLSFTVSVHASPSNALKKRDPPPPSSFDGTQSSGTGFTSPTSFTSISTPSQTSTSSSVFESTSTSSTSTAVTTSTITTSETSTQTSSTESDSSSTVSSTPSITTSSTATSTSASSSIVSVAPTLSTTQSSGTTLEGVESTISGPASSTITSVSSSFSHESSSHSSTSSLILIPATATTPTITVIPLTETHNNGLSTVFYTSTFAQDTPLSSATVSATQTAILTASASKSFWSNKGAVAGTFVTVALVVAAGLAGLAFWNIRRRKARYDIDDEAFFGTNEQTLQRSDTYGADSRESADPDLTEKAMTVPQLENSYPSRDVHYGFEQNNYAAYGLDYPPEPVPLVDSIQQPEEYNYAGQPRAISIPEAQYGYAVDYHVQERQYPAAQDMAYDAYTQYDDLSAQPYAQDTDNARHSRLAPTIDSFYGADNLTSQA